MSLLSRLIGAVVILTGALMPLSGAAQVAATNGRPDFQLTTTRHELEGIGHYFRAVAKVGTNQFAFIVPKGYFMRVDEANRLLRAVEREDKCAITVRVMESPTNAMDKATATLKPEVFRELLLQRHPSAKIAEELSLSAGGQSGPAFDFVWKNSSGLSLHSRIAFIPTPAGLIEFHLITSAAEKEEFTYALNSLMLTFRFAVNGRLELPEMSNKL
ncbi:MAG: hypothetical protein ABMA26_17070 [Limisphaerales bacterium]